MLGLDNFSEDQYENLRTDTFRARETVAILLELYPDEKDVQAVLSKIDEFSDAMDASDWDVSLALRSPAAVQGAFN